MNRPIVATPPLEVNVSDEWIQWKILVRETRVHEMKTIHLLIQWLSERLWIIWAQLKSWKRKSNLCLLLSLVNKDWSNVPQQVVGLILSEFLLMSPPSAHWLILLSLHSSYKTLHSSYNSPLIVILQLCLLALKLNHLSLSLSLSLSLARSVCMCVRVRVRVCVG